MGRVTDNHFISVSKHGVLTARRKGCPPVEVARAEDGMRVEPGRAMSGEVRVWFAPGGSAREVKVLRVSVGSRDFEIDEFLEQFKVTEAELGRWMRRAVEAALDAAK